MALYFIKDTTLTGIADAIRSKTGNSASIPVADMASQILGITGGGSVEGAHTVTFMSEDGQTVLGTKPVMNGDTCGNPIGTVIPAIPTKESSAQYEYTFNGWSLTAGGDADSNALVNVTEDRTVYAAFKAETRAYTIRFYDGETLLQTMVCEYGTTPSYTPIKDGYELSGWEPKITSVTGNADYYAQWTQSISGTHGDATWTIKNGVMTISGEGFLPGVAKPENQPWYDYNTIITKLVIESGITAIYQRLFEGLISLTEVILPDTLTDIGYQAFAHCDSLEEFICPNSVTKLGSGTVYSCDKLKRLVLSSNLTEVSNIFNKCPELKEITIPAKVSKMSNLAFSSDTHFTSITFENPNGWWWANVSSATSGSSIDFSDPIANAELLQVTYVSKYWRRS